MTVIIPFGSMTCRVHITKNVTVTRAFANTYFLAEIQRSF